MPQAVPVIIAWTQTSIVGAIVGALAKIALSTMLTRALGKNDRQGAPPINVTVNSTVAERRLCFGTVRAGGAFVFVATSGTNNKYLWYVIAYAGHQCSALKDLYLDKFKVPAADINGTTGVVSTASLDGKLTCWDHLGTGAQAADTNLDSAFTEWTSNHKLSGICYRALRLERSDKAWPNGAPQSCTSVLDGALLYDPRLDSTNGGAGTHRLTDPSTWAFSRNWALGVRWFLSGGSVVNDQSTRLIRYGVQASDSRINDAYITAAANIADQSLSGANAPPGGAEVRYTLDYEAACTQTRRDILEDMLTAGGPGQLVWLHGTWRLYAGAYDAPVLSFSQDDLHDEIVIDDTEGDENRFNQISGIYIDSEKDFTEQTTPVRSNSSYVTQDNAKKIPKTQVSLRGVSRQYQAQRVVERMLRDGRQMRKVVFPFGRQGMRLAPWETFNYSDTAYGWTSRVFRVLERDIVRTDTGGVICKITAKACASSVDTDLLTAEYTTGTSVTNSLQSEAPDPPTSLTATSKVGTIEFNWTLGDFWLRNGNVELYEYTANTPFASATLVWTGRGTWASIPKGDTTIRYYWIRVVTIGGQASTTEPSGNGLAGVAQPITDIITDPEFSLDTSTAYWLPYTTNSGTVAISATGGANGGKATLTSGGASSQATVVSRRRPAFQMLPGSFFTITARWRRTATIGGLSGILGFGATRHQQDPASASTFNIVGSDVQFGYGRILLALGDVNARTVNVWQEDSATIWFPKDPAFSPGASTFVSAYAQMLFDTAADFIEVDMLNLSQGVASEPYVIRYTDTLGAATPTADVVFFKKYWLDSVSNYTFPLPSAQTSYIGAKIYFEARNTGTLTISPSGGNTMRSAPSSTANRALNGRGAIAMAECISATEWQLTGNLV